MTTKAEAFQYREQRSGPKKAARIPRGRRAGAGERFPSRRNRSKDAARRARPFRRGVAGARP